MEAKPKSEYSLPSSGSFRYVDDYKTIYEVTWETTTSGLDITTVTKVPYVWGQPDTGYRRGTALFRRGIVTTHRQIIANDPTGYVIRSEGFTQAVDFFQVNFPCGAQPYDPFGYHLNNGVSDSDDLIVTCGPRWADPDEAGDDNVSWGDISATGGDLVDITAQSFQWIDAWSNDEVLDSTCPP